MIAKHIHCQPEHDHYGRLARYIADAGHDGEKCLANWCAGCDAEDDYELAALEVTAVQGLNTRSAKEKTYHLIVSFHPEDEARLTPEVFKAIEERFAAALGFSGHQRHCGVHKNTNNLHLHIAYNMVHPEKLTRHAPYFDYQQLSKTCRHLEQAYGLAVDNGMEQARKDRLSQKAATLEARTGQESFESYAKRHKDKILAALEAAGHWQDLHETLKAHGLGIKPHGNGMVVTNSHGEQATKASAVDRALSAKRLHERLGPFQPYQALRRIQEVSRYESTPLHRSPERGELFAEYKTGIEARKTRLAAVKEKEEAALAAIRAEWVAKRQELERMDIAKRNRRNLLALARKYEAEALAKARLDFQKERAAIRTEIPFAAWNAFLQMKAESGNETALAVLRSREKIADLETAPTPPAVPAKDWSQHGREQFSGQRAAVRAEYARKERELQERTDVSATGKKQLQTFLRMERVIAEARAAGLEPGEVKRRVDGKGVVIFTLADGGSIRDAGNDLYFTNRDRAAEALALLYARVKWGKGVSLDGNRIIRSVRECEPEVASIPHRGMER